MARRRPGRPREHPTPKKLGIRFHPDLFTRMDDYLVNSEPETTQRAFIERAVARELDNPTPSEGVPDAHHADPAVASGDAGD